MRIFYAAGATPLSSASNVSQLWKRNLFDSLVDMGHKVIPFSKDVTGHFEKYPKYKTSPLQAEKFFEYKADLQTTLIEELTSAQKWQKIDLFFSYFWSEICDPDTIKTIKAMGIPTVNWFCNASYQFHLIADLAPHYDWCLVPEKFRLKDYRAVGARPIYCQEAANPKVYQPYNLPLEFEVVFVGQAYGDRPAYIKHLLEHDIDVRVWGTGWQKMFSTRRPSKGRPRSPLQRTVHLARKLMTAQGWQAFGRKLKRNSSSNHGQKSAAINGHKAIDLPDRILGGILPDTEMIKMYSRAKINLGFSSCGDTHQSDERITQIRLRDFEVPMSGGFYVVEYMEELAEFFEIGREIVCYHNPEDLAEKIKYYLYHEAEREAIRRAGYERCQRDHTWQKRFEMAFGEMGLA